VVFHLKHFEMRRPNATTLPPAAALRAHGVTPKYPLTGRSGVRADDGMVLFVLCAEDIITDSEGARCLLWAPGGDDSAARRERLEHCIRALGHGQAEALLALARGTQVDSSVAFAVRVERHRREYWAKWGSASRLIMPAAHGTLGQAFAA
jgi:hypothetical protein